MNETDVALAGAQGASRLVDWGVIRAQGADAGTFLQGQLTQDVLHLDANRFALAGYCSPKGRLLASGLLWRPADDEWLWACSADVLPATLKRLSMYVLRARCKLSDASAELPLHGLVGDAAAHWLGAETPPSPWQRRFGTHGHVLRLPDGHVDALDRGPRADADGGSPAVPRFVLARPAALPAPDLPALDAAAWAWFEAASGIPRIVGPTVEQFVPQMVNFEVVGGVNFKKGCYPGQEIVARSQYRGSVKRRGIVCAAEAPARPGVEVFHSADPSQPAGQVVLGGSWRDSHGAFVELKLAALEGGSLRLQAADGPRLWPVTPPYPMPADGAD